MLRDLVEEDTAADGVTTNVEAPGVTASVNIVLARASNEEAVERTVESATLGPDSRAVQMAGPGPGSAAPGKVTATESRVRRLRDLHRQSRSNGGGRSRRDLAVAKTRMKRRSDAGVKKPT
ncbi:hypothetical protein PR003_g26927 [Phytophthora rubi]|uniref:Uncharacterized protein n=1 Tax=Phytophthora rubi TaxID=129364 RepID=A0A6A4C292_9STRA|nr:hypothetical protein PR002_g26315 [Phytophthora rubi]KAE8976216.1 hypothetical protein PR001_g25482 [Phytophthora rubi]KAE9284149.1 hypothetical protein PR003_g26927 [Phytophthora rubi]